MGAVPAPESPADPIALKITDGIAHLTLQRPPLNILDLATLGRLNAALRECDAGAARVVLISSSLPRAFSAGVEIRDHVPAQLGPMLAEVRENARLLLGLKAVTIGAIRGSTLGGGAELALLCDLLIAGDDLSFGFPEIGLGAFPPIAAAILPDRLSSPLAMRLLLGELIDAPTAERHGLVSTVVPPEQLADATNRTAERVAAFSAVALFALIRATRGQRATVILQRLDAAMATYRAVVGPSKDSQEGIDAFLEKREPAWSHR
jgi:enoyl-CoA hydratase/carnithine racemase